MDILTFLLDNWDSVLVVLVFAAVCCTLAKHREMQKLQQILFGLITQAEKQFGSKTGELKFSAVADWIYQRIPKVLQLLFTAADIENIIETMLEDARTAWKTSGNLIASDSTSCTRNNQEKY